MSERDDETTRPRSAASCRARWAYLKRMNRTPLWARYLGSADERIRRSAADVQIITMEKTAEHDVMASANVTPSKLFPRRRLWTASEDARLREAMSVIDSRPRTRWNHVAEMVRTRDALQCLKRWQLIREQTPSGAVRSEPRPEPVPWSMDEDRKLWDAVHTLGRRWRDVQTRIDGRSAQECCWRYNALIRQLQRRLQENRGRCKTTAYRYWTREESAMLHQVVQEYSAQAAASDSHIYWPAVALEFTTRMQQVNGNYVARNTGSCRAKHYFDIIRADRQVSENTARSRCRGWLPHEIARLYIAMEEEDSLIASNPHPATPRKRGPQGLRGGDYWKHVSEALRDGDPAIHRSMAACMGKFYRDRAASADGELYETAAQRSAKRHRRAWSPAEVTALDRIVTKRLSLQHDIHWPSVAREMGELVPGSRRTSHQCRSKYRNDSVDGFDRVFNEGVARMGG